MISAIANRGLLHGGSRLVLFLPTLTGKSSRGKCVADFGGESGEWDIEGKKEKNDK